MFLPCILNILIVSFTILQDNIVFGKATIVTHSPFNPDADAIAIYKAMKGFGTDEAKIISIATKRTHEQRLEIKDMYERRFDRSIFKDFKGDLGGNFLKIMTAMFQPIPLFYATAIRNAVKSVGTVDQAVTGIFCCLPDGLMDEIVEAYKSEFKRDLKKDVIDDTSGYYRELLQALMKVQRAPSKSFHSNASNSLGIAKKLIKAGVGIVFGTEEKPIIDVFSTSSYKELAEVADVYEKFINMSLEASVIEETSGHFQDLLLQILRYAKSPVTYYIDLLKVILHRSYLDVVIHNHSTASDTLIRILLTRSELDLQEIGNEYKKFTQKSLAEDVKGATSGDFEKACVGIVRGNV